MIPELAGSWLVPSARVPRERVLELVRVHARKLGLEPDDLVARRGSSWVVPRGVALSSSFRDARTKPAARLLQHGVALRPYQRAAVDKATRAGGGVIVAPCGSGKTTMGCELIARTPTRALVLVHTRDLVRQWQERIERDLRRVDVGGIEDGGRIAVETVQRLARMKPSELARHGAKYGLVVVDEAHHVPASTWGTVLSHLPGMHRYGLTATPERLDERHPMLHAHLGPIVAEVAAAEVEKAGAALRPQVSFVLTGSSGARHDDAGRDGTIARLARAELGEGRHVLILVHRVDHAGELAKRISTRAAPVVALTSQLSDRERARALADLRAGRVRGLVATTLADEGLDLPELETVILAVPSSSLGRVIQRIGRILRPGRRKVARVYDLVDDDAMKAALEREQLYEDRGWDVAVRRRGAA